jgi:hypothetical protein
VTLWHVIIKAKAVKQRLLQDRPLTHHGPTSRLLRHD